MTAVETTNLLLRVPCEADFDAWAALDADEIAMRFIGGARRRAESWIGLAAVIGMWTMRRPSLFSVLDKSTGRWLGRAGPWCPEGALGPEIGWALARGAWGRGHATEAASAAMAWSFAAFGWTEVIHCIAPDNSASIAVAGRLGARWLRNAVDNGGNAVQVYGQTAAEWRRANPRSSSG